MEAPLAPSRKQSLRGIGGPRRARVVGVQQLPSTLGRIADAAVAAAAANSATTFEVEPPQQPARPKEPQGQQDTAASGPHYPLPPHTRVKIAGRGYGNYVRFTPNFWGRHSHTVYFDDEQAEQTLTSDRWLPRAACPCCQRPHYPIASGWEAVPADPAAAIFVSSLYGPKSAELQRIPIHEGTLMYELQAQISAIFGVPMECQRLTFAGNDTVATGNSPGHSDLPVVKAAVFTGSGIVSELVPQIGPLEPIYRAGLHSGTWLLLVVCEARAAGHRQREGEHYRPTAVRAAQLAGERALIRNQCHEQRHCLSIKLKRRLLVVLSVCACAILGALMASWFPSCHGPTSLPHNASALPVHSQHHQKRENGRAESTVEAQEEQAEAVKAACNETSSTEVPLFTWVGALCGMGLAQYCLSAHADTIADACGLPGLGDEEVRILSPRPTLHCEMSRCTPASRTQPLN